VSGIQVPNSGKPVSFRLVKEEGYLYELTDGAVVRIKCRLRRLARSQFGTFIAEADTELILEAPSPNMVNFQPARFEYPKLLREGCYTYLADGKESVRIRPSLTLVERTSDARGAPIYVPSAFWIPDLDRRKVIEAMTLPATFARVGGSQEAMTLAATRQKELLEWLFQGKGWFLEKRNEGHPAYLDWKLCDQMVGWRGRKPDSLKSEDLRFAARISLNTHYLIRLSGGDLGVLTPGVFESFGDENVQKKIRSRVLDPSSYEDLLVELYTASWHKGVKDHTASLLEKTGYPDVRVSINSLDFPIFIECKRVKVSSVNQIQSDIKDASRQLATASQGADSNAYGAVLLDFSSFVGLRRQEDDSHPPVVVDVMQKVRQAIRGDKNTHVKSAIVVWDDYGLVGKEPEQVLVFRRRAEVIHHDHTRHPLGLEKLFDGYAVRSMLRQVPDEML
jgi:hypothetical protein